MLQKPKEWQLYFFSFRTKTFHKLLRQQEGGFVSPSLFLQKRTEFTRVCHKLVTALRHGVHEHKLTFTCHEQAPLYGGHAFLAATAHAEAIDIEFGTKKNNGSIPGQSF